MFRSAVTLCVLAVASSSAHAASRDVSATYVESGDKTYWSNGKLPENLKITVRIEIGKGQLLYEGLNTTQVKGEPAPADNKGHVTAFSGPIDGKIHESKGAYWDHLSIREIDDNEYLVEKYRDGVLVVGEFLKFSPDASLMIRHGVVARAAADGTTKAYVEYFHKQ